MAVSKVLLLAIVLVFLSSVTAQFGGLGGFDFFSLGFGGKPFGKPGGFGGKPGLGGLGGKPGKPGSLGGLGGLGGLGDLYRYKGPEDTGAPYYNWENAPTHN